MQLISLELYLYKPLMHNGIKHVVVDEFPSITVIAGENGSGKSSLLRECTPFPACRTDYEKSGLKKITYIHDGSTYCLTSDFSKVSGAHSFLKDGIELNESGTTEVQEELVETHLGYSSIVSKLVSGKLNICDLGKPDRKAIIMATYPSSMAFILEYHKIISTNLRSINNNIKMLSQRELSLKGQIISTSILAGYKEEREDLNNAISTIDVDIYTINKSIEQVNQVLGTVNNSILAQTPDSFIRQISSVQHRFAGLLKTASNLPDANMIKITIERLNAIKTGLESSIKENNKLALEVKSEIEKYEKYLSTDNEENIKECKRLIEVQDEILKSTPVDAGMPVLTKTEYDGLESNYQSLLNTIIELKQSPTPFWSEDNYRNVEVQLSITQQSISSLNNNLAQINDTIKMLEIRLEKQKKNTWPEDCKRVCPLRSNLEDIIKNIETQLNDYTKERDNLNGDRDRLIKEYESLKSELQVRSADRQVLSNLSRYFSSISWAPFVLNNLNLIDSLNSDVSKIYNNITRLLDNSKNYIKHKEALELKTCLEHKLENFTNSSMPAEQLIKESILKREVQLNSLINKINEDKARISSIERENYNNSIYDSLISEVQRIESDYNIWKKAYVLQQEIKEYRSFIDSIMQSRMLIQNKLRELDSIIREQDSYLIRLNDEVLPELTKLQKQYDELSIVEAQLSPTKGIPHHYLTKYINTILTIANKFINRVWSYPMEFQYLNEEDETFDFSFPIILNNNTKIKDCNMGSAGQQAIINLCFTLAICIFKQYSLSYPLIFDEVTVNMSLNHQNSLILFINELLTDKDSIKQMILVDHCVDVCSSFTNTAKMLKLSKDMEVSENWGLIGKIE